MLVELVKDEYLTDEEAAPDQSVSTTREVKGRDMALTTADWDSSVELEAFLARPQSVKETIEHGRTVTGAQSLMLMRNLIRNAAGVQPLLIQLSPVSIRMKHRKRQPATVDHDLLDPVVTIGRQVLAEQLETRFFSEPPPESRMVQIFMSKQVPASQVLPSEWLQSAEAFYLQWLRRASDTARRAAPRSSPRKRLKTAAACASLLLDAFEPQGGDDAEGMDPVGIEVKLWAEMTPDVVAPFKDK